MVKMKPEPRLYQKTIYASILEYGNTLVVLPTGLGKTLIGFMLIENKIKQGNCLFLAPTKPLIKQHFQSFLETKTTNPTNISIITGETPKTKRQPLYEKKVIFSTPQTVRNDLLSGVFKNPEQYSLCIFDEAHKTIGNYAYTLIAEKMKENALIVGFTASPGGRRERINEILTNLFIQNVQIRTQQDSDVREYVKNINISWVETQLTPDLKIIKNELDRLISQYTQKLIKMGIVAPIKSKRLFIQLRQKILNMDSKIKYAAIVVYSFLFNLLHMQELTETQGVSILKKYLEKLETKTTKSAKILLQKPELIKIKQILVNTQEEHPKISLLINLIEQLKGKKIIVFAHYRDQVSLIENTIKKMGIEARAFLGKKNTYTKKQQEETINQFREHKFNILITTSVGEEGLDIPNVDNVIFYEPIPSEIRAIQRRGRTGRFKQGQVYILITKGTRDEFFQWASINREKRMKYIMGEMQKKPHSKPIKTNENIQYKLNRFF